MPEFSPDELPDLEKRAEAAEERKLSAVRAKGREAAIDRGRALGEDTARQRGETGLAAEQRARRAMRYAAWEYDRKPIVRTEEYDDEFGMKTTAGTLSAWRVGKRTVDER